MSKTLEKPELKSAEARYFESQQHELVKYQARALLRILKRYRENVAALRKELEFHPISENKTLKPESIELALSVMSKRGDHFSEEMREIVGNVLIKRKIESVVMTGPLKMVGDEVNSDELLKELSKGVKNENIPKHHTKLNKEGEYVCAIIGGNIAHYIMGDNSPKMRLYKDYSGKVSVVFNFIKSDFSAIGEFHSIKDIPKDNVGVFLKNAGGFANFFATNILIADHDFDISNVGLIVNRDSGSYWTKINYNKALSYNKSINFAREKLYSIEELKNISGLENSEIKYPELSFTGIDFACELNESVRNFDEKKLRRIIKVSINNIREVYGHEFLSHSSIESELKSRLEFKDRDVLTEQVIEDKIIKNIQSLCNQIRHTAEQEFTRSLNEKGIINKHKELDYKQFFERNKTPVNLDLFMKFAIISGDFKGVEYLNNLNKELELDDIKIDKISPLEYALKVEQNELAIKMMKAGFLLYKGQTPKTEEEIKNIEIALRNIVERNVARPKLRKRNAFEYASV